MVNKNEMFSMNILCCNVNNNLATHFMHINIFHLVETKKNVFLSKLIFSIFPFFIFSWHLLLNFMYREQTSFIGFPVVHTHSQITSHFTIERISSLSLLPFVSLILYDFRVLFPFTDTQHSIP